MPDVDTTIANGDPNHAGLHLEVALEVNSLRARVAKLEADLTALTSTVNAKAGLVASTTIPKADRMVQADWDAATTKPTGLIVTTTA